MASSIIDSAKSILGIHSPSRVFKDEVGIMIGKGMASGIKDSTKEAATASSKMSKAVLDAAKEWIDEKKYYNKLSLEEELYTWEQVQKKMIKGSEELKQVNKELYRVKMELSKREYDNSINWIEDRKYYNNLTLSEELAAYERIQKRYAKGTEERKKADREIYRLNNEINNANDEYYRKTSEIQTAYMDKRKQMEDDYYEKTKSINDKLIEDIRNVNKEYEDAITSRANALYSTYGLFDSVEASDPTNGEQLIFNLQQQIKSFETWQKNMKDLAAKGVDEGLIKELQEMGPKSNAQIEALNKMTDSKLIEYVTLWKTKHSEAKNQAVTELESLRLQTINKITELNAQTAIELSNYTTIWSQQMTTLNTETNNQLTNLQTEWRNKIGMLAVDTSTQFNNLNNDIQDSVNSLRTSTETEFTTLADNIQNIMKKPDWKSIGINIIDGITKGIKNRAYILAAEVAYTAKLALQAAKNVLGIHSPSKEFEKLGMYVDQGFANGLSNFSGTIISTTKDVGNSTIYALKDTISNMSDIINGNVDTSPVIRPVIDMSAVEIGGKQIDSVLSKKYGIDVSSINDKIPNIGTTKTQGDSSNQPTDNPGQGNIQFVQNNYSPNALSRIDIYRQTKNQISTMKGLLGL
jgi:hypothetical protein